jgi:hypothetical protein
VCGAFMPYKIGRTECGTLEAGKYRCFDSCLFFFVAFEEEYFAAFDPTLDAHIHSFFTKICGRALRKQLACNLHPMHAIAAEGMGA